MSDLLDIGSSGLSAYRNALTAIGENVANAETPGYARRSVVLAQTTSGGSGDPIYREQVTFNGVSTLGVQRAWDQFKASEARYATSAYGRAEARQQWLTAVESALDDGASGVGASMTGFFNAATALAAIPDDALARSTFMTALTDVAGAFRTTGSALARVSEGIATAAGIDAEAVNNALAALYDINGSIRSSPPGGSARASLEDQRDKLIDDICERIDATATIAGDGTANLSPSSDASVSLLGPAGAGFVTVTPAADGRLSLTFSVAGTSFPLPLTGGRLAGLVDVASATADRRAALDVLAADFADGLNAWSAAGIDSNGTAGADLIEAPAGAVSMNVLLDDPDLIPAASTDGRPNGNLLDLETVRTAGNFEARWTAAVASNAQALASAKSEAAASLSWRDYSRAGLDEVTGIDLDREAADLLRYQQAYNGAARIIQVARETINAIFDLI